MLVDTGASVHFSQPSNCSLLAIWARRSHRMRAGEKYVQTSRKATGSSDLLSERLNNH